MTYGWRDTDFDVKTAPVTTPGATWSASPVLSRNRSDGETLTASAWKGLPLADSGFLTMAAEYKDNETGLHVIRMPEHYGALSPLLHVVPLQLLAYHTACARGTDVDKPRNLAKSVTVE